MLNNNIKKALNIFFTEATASYINKRKIFPTKLLTNNLPKTFLSIANLNYQKKLINNHFTKTSKKSFAEKSSTEDLIEQILQSKSNINTKKTYGGGQENANLTASSIYSRNNANSSSQINGNGNNYYSQNAANIRQNSNSNNANGNYQNGYQSNNNNDFALEREANYGNGNGNYNNNNFNNLKN